MYCTVGMELFKDVHLTTYRDDRPTIIQSADMQTAQTGSPALPALDAAQVAFADQALQAIQAHPARRMLAKLNLGLSGGSNSFVVGGDRTQTGMPILANDPHMGVSMPALWYQVGMHCSEKTADCPYNFRGYSLPGVPGILIGHNDRIAWGLTNAAFDAEDVFIEKINPANPNQYEVNGKWQDMEIRREEIKVRGRDEPVVIQVRKTRNGLVATDHLIDRQMFSYEDNALQPYALSFAWTTLDPVLSAQAVIKVNKAQNWDEFVNALQYFEAGKQNWLYADVDGNIGYNMPGKVPIPPRVTEPCQCRAGRTSTAGPALSPTATCRMYLILSRVSLLPPTIPRCGPLIIPTAWACCMIVGSAPTASPT